MKNTIFLLVLFSVHTAYAQTCFTYDNAGNRIQRYYCCSGCLISSPNQADPSSGMQQAENQDVLVVPNPNHGFFHLQPGQFPPETEVMVYAQSGRLVLQRLLKDGYFDMSMEATGLYVMVLNHPALRPKTLKIEIINE